MSAMQKLGWGIGLGVWLGLAGCVSSHDAPLSKEQARSQGGKGDSGEDYCNDFGWYGDGVCDEFCVEPDPDCTAETGCGGPNNLACDDNEFCDYAVEVMCGAADQLGSCRPVPQNCPAVFNPVCGCDGATYDTACAAAASEVSVAHTGACEATSGEQTCGGPLEAACDEGKYCHYDVEDSCGADDRLGTCRTPPDVCPAGFDFACGCDGETYDTPCHAQSAGVSVAYKGRCTEGGM